MLLEWLITSLLMQHTNVRYEIKLHLLEQVLQQVQEAAAAREERLRHYEQQMCQNELELPNLSSQLANWEGKAATVQSLAQGGV